MTRRGARWPGATDETELREGVGSEAVVLIFAIVVSFRFCGGDCRCGTAPQSRPPYTLTGFRIKAAHFSEAEISFPRLETLSEVLFEKSFFALHRGGAYMGDPSGAERAPVDRQGVEHASA